MKLSKTESRLLSAMEQRRKGNHRWTIEELANVAYGGTDEDGRERPFYWENSLQALMRNLIIKTCMRTPSVKRLTGLGRGNKAEYGMSTGSKNAFLSRKKAR